ncbi:MAG: tol-pal system protein YbgF [Hyphomicrobiales bacterium]|nr:tol-pal system protein YbgF [Hyphomicrobiales bacterium]
MQTSDTRRSDSTASGLKAGLLGVLLAAAAALPAPASAGPAMTNVARPTVAIEQAQFFNRPQDNAGAETAELLLRVDRLENQIRNLNGQLEQMQFQVRRSEEQLRKFQQDVEFRFQELSGGRGGARPQAAPAQPGKRSDAGPDPIGNLAARDLGASDLPSPDTRVAEAPDVIQAPAAAPPLASPGGLTPRGGSRGDAFDPTANPDAPGAPRPLGSMASASTPLPPVSSRTPGAFPAGPLDADDDPNAPLDLAPGARNRRAAAIVPPAASPVPATRPGAQPPTTAALPPASPRDDYDLALAAYNQGQYDTAETGLKSFLQRNPKDRMSGEAVFYLGEIYFRRGRHRDAAEQYLKISTDYPKTTHAADALVRLGVSLDKLGAKEQACAFFSEVGRKYPAATTVKASAQREAKRIQC